MITTILLYSIYYSFKVFYALVPSGHLPATVLTALGSFQPYYKYALPWFPVDTMLQVVLMMFAVEAIFIVWWTIMTIGHFIRGSG
jgi:hypothetical protein